MDEQDEQADYDEADLEGLKVGCHVAPARANLKQPRAHACANRGTRARTRGRRRQGQRSGTRQLAPTAPRIAPQVAHDAESLREGETVILTLADSQILNPARSARRALRRWPTDHSPPHPPARS